MTLGARLLHFVEHLPGLYLALAAFLAILLAAATGGALLGAVRWWNRRQWDLKTYRKRAERGDGEAQFKLASILLLQSRVVPDEHERSLTDAIGWFRKAANGGHAQAQVGLAGCLTLSGQVEEALTWNRKAADQGDALGMYGCATAYRHGMGVGRDIREAFAWYLAATETGRIVGDGPGGLRADLIEDGERHGKELVGEMTKEQFLEARALGISRIPTKYRSRFA